jgi:hypothetical protein
VKTAAHFAQKNLNRLMMNDPGVMTNGRELPKVPVELVEKFKQRLKGIQKEVMG